MKVLKFLSFSIVIFSVFLFIFSVVSCAVSLKNAKTGPEYTGVDKKVQYLINDYKRLAKRQHITFNNEVTIGFKKIKKGRVIGQCNYAKTFREIDLDLDYWNKASETSKFTLVMHEATHCYCGRGHDYAEDKNYQDYSFFNVLRQVFEKKDKEGFFEDKCPMSIMHPVIVDDFCMFNHYAHYMEEMFERCEAF